MHTRLPANVEKSTFTDWPSTTDFTLLCYLGMPIGGICLNVPSFSPRLRSPPPCLRTRRSSAVAASGDLLALLPSGDLNVSSEASFGTSPSQAVDKLINTATQDDGQIFADTDTDQLLAITGFNSQIFDVRLFLDPTDPVRFPSSVTIFFSKLSTTSVNSADSNYTGSNGGELLPKTTLTASSITPVAGAHSGPIDFLVNGPTGTQTLLFDFGPVTSLGIRVAEVQAFATPEPASLGFLATLAVGSPRGDSASAADSRAAASGSRRSVVAGDFCGS
ncbi:MAG TPA: hypothetical protein VMH81_17615 [Bryobacteraceae bacterium]|nr:hypothetical protein [Bryobacteraceae bacterium]